MYLGWECIMIFPINHPSHLPQMDGRMCAMCDTYDDLTILFYRNDETSGTYPHTPLSSDKEYNQYYNGEMVNIKIYI